MGKGLSPLQKDILAVLDEWPSLESYLESDSKQLGALPRDIIRRLGRLNNGTTRASMSRALLRLHERGLVSRASGIGAMAGKAFQYLKITNSANAGWGNDGPVLFCERKPMKTVHQLHAMAATA
jgi:hypothetical protein